MPPVVIEESKTMATSHTDPPVLIQDPPPPSSCDDGGGRGAAPSDDDNNNNHDDDDLFDDEKKSGTLTPQEQQQQHDDEKPAQGDSEEDKVAPAAATENDVEADPPKQQQPPEQGEKELDMEPSVAIADNAAISPSSTAQQSGENDVENTVVSVSDVVPPPGTSTKSMPVPPNNAENEEQSNIELQRSRSETDASSPTVDVPMAAEDLSSELQEFLSSPHGNNQIVERSPGGRYVRFIEKLGSGASKDVYRAYDTQEGIEVAWNVVHLAGVPKQERNRIVNEVRLLERLHHQNIISFHGSWVNRERQQVNFVTEILSSGTLKSFINRVQVIRWKIAKRWAVQILKGLEYLHSQDPPVIHRDLKCENIFINGTSGDLRIGDLGLSTVHRNGKVLSVLGTPEFMAPDMYDETPYDEKVDIYAFGMCLLEMFTKEIPYRECNNPAQIYKKVMRGAPPDSLLRLKSKHAREFIQLCLGYRDKDGSYIRPSVTELLEHPFLIKRAVDDDEVEVDPPLREQPIREGGESNDNASPEGETGGSLIVTSGKGGSSKAPQPSYVRQNSLELDEKDGFDQMPDSEVNSIRKVTVMMGRDEELKEEDEAVEDTEKQKAGVNSKEATALSNPSTEVASVSSQQNANTAAKNEDPNGQTLHYLVAAAVLEDEERSNIQSYGEPYPDDTLKLVVTLPVDGQTQNVQFDFHLVEDDPIQVAKEMVEELEIPNGAVLEISETISGLARSARTKKHKFNASQGQPPPRHVRGPSSLESIPSGVPPQQQQHLQQQQIAQNAMQPPPQHQLAQNPMQMQQPQQPIAQNAMPPQQQQPQHYAQAPMPPHQQPQQQPQHLVHGMQHPSMQDFIPPPQHQQQQLPQQHAPPQHQQPSQTQGVPIQDQGNRMQGQPQQLQAQHALLQGNGQSHQPQTQAPFSQPGSQVNAPHPSQNHGQQPPPQMQRLNGEYHQHVQTEKFSQAPAPYGQLPGPPPSNPPLRSTSNASAPQQSVLPMQHQQQVMMRQETANSYPAPSPAGQVGAAGYPANHGNTPGHAMQQSGPVQQQQQPQQHLQHQPMQGPSQAVGQGYGQNYGQQQPMLAPPQQQQQHFQPMHQQVGQPQQAQNLQQQVPQVVNHQMQQPLPPPQQQQPLQQPHLPAVQRPPQQNQQQRPPQQGQQPLPSHLGPQGQQVVSAAVPSNLSSQMDASVGERAPTVPQSAPAGPAIIRRDSDTSVTIGGDHSGQPGLQQQQQWDSQHIDSGALGGLSTRSSDDETTEDDCAEELRRLDEDFQKNVSRANKVFVSRMDNLQRTQTQRESQHQKTLEQHQKERAAFEKRLHQEEIEQNRRIEQMQKDWEQRREELRLKTLAEASNTDMSSDTTAGDNVSSLSPPLLNGSSLPTTTSAKAGSGSLSDGSAER